MKETQIICQQCGGEDTYIESEKIDYTAPASTWIYHKKWVCPHCGWPDTVLTKWGSYTINAQPQYKLKVTVTDQNGKDRITNGEPSTKNLPQECQTCSFLKEGHCQDNYLDKLCTSHLKDKEP